MTDYNLRSISIPSLSEMRLKSRGGELGSSRHTNLVRTNLNKSEMQGCILSDEIITPPYILKSLFSPINQVRLFCVGGGIGGLFGKFGK